MSAELVAASNYSFLRGASHPADMVATALALGLSGVGIADRNTVAGTARAHLALREAAAAAREAGLDTLAGLEGDALAAAADAWSAQLADPATRLYATLFDLQSIDAIRIIEGRG